MSTSTVTEPITLEAEKAEELRKILLHCIGDSKKCQRCGEHTLTDESPSELAAKAFYTEIFKG